MADQTRGYSTQKQSESTTGSRQAVKFLTASGLSAVLLGLSGLTLTGTVIALIIATPLLVIFSPVLVPAVIAVFLIGTGFLFSGGCGVAAITAVSWLYQYVTGRHPPGADQLDYARMKISGATREAKDKVKESGPYSGQQRSGYEGSQTTTTS